MPQTMSEVPQDSLDPTPAMTREDFARYLRMLRVRADTPTYRTLEKRALELGPGVSMPRTSLGEVLAGRRFPSKSFLMTYLKLCGVDPESDRRWETTWNRLAVEYKVVAGRGKADLAVPDDRLVRLQAEAARSAQETAHVREVLQNTRTVMAAAASMWEESATLLERHGHYAIARSLRDVASVCSDLVADPEAEVAAAGQNSRQALAEVLQGLRAAVGHDADPFGLGVGPVDGRLRGSLPEIWNVEPRNPDFTGRESVLTELSARLTAGGAAVVQALRGIGGVGKTQIAVEYAHRMARAYDIVWWINAEDPALIGEQLAALAQQLRLTEAGTDTATAVALVKSHLRVRDRWLLVFDNAEERIALRNWLPGGLGHVIITSRAGGWEHIAGSVRIDVMTRSEAIGLLLAHQPDISQDAANRLAEALGDLPLALSQAGGFLSETGTAVESYLRLLDQRADAILNEGLAGDYPRSLAAAVRLSFEQLVRTDSLAAEVIRLCSFLAPETVPIPWLRGCVDHPGADDDLALRRSIAAAVRLGLATSTTSEGIRIHRLLQNVLRAQTPESERADMRVAARNVLLANHPGDPEDPQKWAEWGKMVPHLLAVNPANHAGEELRRLSCEACWYLIERGDAHAAERLARDLREQWIEDQGPDDVHVLWVSRAMGRALRELGQYEQARVLYEDTLARYRTVLGEDNPFTLRLAHGHAINLRLLGRYREARELQEATLQRYRTAIGVDDSSTLHSANHLGVDLLMLGEYDKARALHEDTLERYRRVLGPNHPDTLRCANHLAVDLRALGQTERASTLQRETLVRRQQVYGNRHPDTLQAATGLGETLLQLKQYRDARGLLDDTLERLREVLGPDHPHSLHAATRLAEAMHHLGDHRAAQVLQEDTLSRQRRVLGEDHPETKATVEKLAQFNA